MRIVVKHNKEQHTIETADMLPYERGQCLRQLFLNKYGKFKNDPEANKPRARSRKKFRKGELKESGLSNVQA